MIIGLVGEDPNDTTSIKNLLSKKYQEIQFKTVAKKVTGTKLGTEKLKKRLKIELAATNFRYIIFIADLDGLDTDANKKKIKKDWFSAINSLVSNKGIFLLNIYELEALILSDIGNFNRLFGTKLKFTGDPMMKVDPKGHLKKKTAKHRRKYTESDCPEIFEQLDIKTVAKKCKYFKEFLAELDSKLRQAA